MSVEYDITKEIDKVTLSIRSAEKMIIGTDYPDKLKLTESLINLEKQILDIKGTITIPKLKISEDTKLDDLDAEDVFTVRTYNVLKRAGCNTIGDILSHTKEEIAAFRNAGRKTPEEVSEFLAKHGFTLNEQEWPQTDNSFISRVKQQILEEKEFAYADFDQYKADVLGTEPDELPDDDFRYGLERAFQIIQNTEKEK